MYECGMVVDVLAVYSRERVANGGLRLAHTQHHERRWDCMSLALGKDPNSKFKVWLLLNTYCFRLTVKSKKSEVGHSLHLTSMSGHFG